MVASLIFFSGCIGASSLSSSGNVCVGSFPFLCVVRGDDYALRPCSSFDSLQRGEDLEGDLPYQIRGMQLDSVPVYFTTTLVFLRSQPSVEFMEEVEARVQEDSLMSVGYFCNAFTECALEKIP